MRNAGRRLAVLEGKSRLFEDSVEIIFIHSVAPGADGPEDEGPMLAYILKGPQAGRQQSRHEAETAEAFRARCECLIGAPA